MHVSDQYQQFYATGIIPNANRLRCRYDAIINANVDILEGAKVLDVALHNGRWSAAAVLGGKAAHVTGVEPRAVLVEAATRTAAELSIVHQVEFHTATIMDYLFLQRLPDNAFDVVMCSGYFYHTHDHFQLLKEFCRIGRSLILDTEISPCPAIGMFYHREPSDNIGNAVNESDQPTAFVGRPTTCFPPLAPSSNVTNWNVPSASGRSAFESRSRLDAGHWKSNPQAR